MSPFWPTMSIVVGSAAWFAATGLRRGSILSPFSTLMLILISIFGIRPLMMLGAGDFNFYGWDVRAGFDAATIVGFVAILTVSVGYAIGRLTLKPPVGVGATIHGESQTVSDSLIKQSFFFATAVLIAWVVVTAVSGGGVNYLVVMFNGRSEETTAGLSGLPALVPALPVVAALVIAVTRFRAERVASYTSRQAGAYWLVAILCVIPPTAFGNRRFLIPSVIAVLVGVISTSWQKKVRPLWLVWAGIGFTALAILPFVRSAGSRRGRSDLLGAMWEYFQEAGITGVLREFFLSYDTEMFSYVSYFVARLGLTVPYGYGRGTFFEAILSPVPAAIAPGDKWSDVLLTGAFGGGCGDPVCPVPSVVGVLYSDFAFPGLVVGMLVIGILASRFERSLLGASRRGDVILILLAGFAPALARGNSISQLWIATQCGVVLLCIDAVMRYRANRRLTDNRVLVNRSRKPLATRD